MNRHNLEYFHIIETKPNKTLTKSGSCSLCDEHYKFGNRVIAEYNDGHGLVTEPINICDRCFEVEMKEHTKQTGLSHFRK